MAYFDLRTPLGWLFLIGGLLLVIAGIRLPAVSSDGHSLDLNINLFWGIILLLFGAGCLLAARLSRRGERKDSA